MQCQACDSSTAPSKPHAPLLDLDSTESTTLPRTNLVSGQRLPSWPMPVGHCFDAERKNCKSSSGSWVGESWTESKKTRAIDEQRGLAIQGSTRMFYTPLVGVSSKAGKLQWQDVRYEKFDLLGKSLSFTIDLSEVPCGCNAAVYLVKMDAPTSGGSAYCDIQGYDDKSIGACTELDLIEGNQKALQATLHTAQGKGSDGRCNQDGCASNWGRDKATDAAYGLPRTKRIARHVIDSSKPLRVTATFEQRRLNWYDDAGCAFEVRVSQGSTHVQLLDSTRDGNAPRRPARPDEAAKAEAGAGVAANTAAGVGEATATAAPQAFGRADLEETYVAVRAGLVLVASLWTTDDLSWLDGGCDAEYPKCTLADARVAVTNLSIAPLFPEPPSAPPGAPPPAWPRPPPPPLPCPPSFPPQASFIPMPQPPPPPQRAAAAIVAPPSPAPHLSAPSWALSLGFGLAALAACLLACSCGGGRGRGAPSAVPRPKGAARARKPSSSGFERIASAEATEDDGWDMMASEEGEHEIEEECDAEDAMERAEARAQRAVEAAAAAEAQAQRQAQDAEEKAREAAAIRVRAETESRARAAAAARDVAQLEAEARQRNAQARAARARAREQQERRLQEVRATAKANKMATARQAGPLVPEPPEAEDEDENDEEGGSETLLFSARAPMSTCGRR